MLRFASLVVALAAASAVAPIAAAAPATMARAVIGRASVTDGDGLEIRGQHYRLKDSDAFERRQLCQDRSGRTYLCGQRAAFALADKIGRRNVVCRPALTRAGKVQRHYQRIIATCFLGGQDLGGWMVEQGWALPYRSRRIYRPQQAVAKAAARGAWSGSFAEPWVWRAEQRKGLLGTGRLTPG